VCDWRFLPELVPPPPWGWRAFFFLDMKRLKRLVKKKGEASFLKKRSKKLLLNLSHAGFTGTTFL
jgi:hypothetical protein